MSRFLKTFSVFRNEKFLFYFFIIYFSLTPSPSVNAEQNQQIILQVGEIRFYDRFSKPVSVSKTEQLGQAEKIELLNGVFYWKEGDNCYSIKKPGKYKVKEIKKKSNGSSTCRLEAFLQTVLQFNDLLIESHPRSIKDQFIQVEYDYDLFFKTIIYHPDQKFAANTYLSAAAYFNNIANPERVSFILGKLAKEHSKYYPFYFESLKNSDQVKLVTEVSEILNTYDKNVRGTNNFALLIGVENYDDEHWSDLTSPINDIDSIAELLIEKYSLEKDKITKLKNPTYEKILQNFVKLDRQLSKTAGDNNLLVYFAGHGFYEKNSETAYWIPSDGGNPETYKNFISSHIIFSKIKSIPTKHSLLISDACFSGSLIQQFRSDGYSRYYEDLSLRSSKEIITSGGIEPVEDRGKNGRSVFNNALLEVLKKERWEPLSSLDLSIELKKILKRKNLSQSPQYGRLKLDTEGGQFLFVQSNVKVENKLRKVIPFYATRAPQQPNSDKKNELSWDYLKEQFYFILEGDWL